MRNAYYDLMYAIGNLNVQRQSLELAQQSLKDNRARVEIGTMAPLDIVQAEAEVAQREEAVILAEAAISSAEDRLRALVFNPQSPDFWNARIEPTETVHVPADGGRTEARRDERAQKRTDLRSARKKLESNDVNIRYFKTRRCRTSMRRSTTSRRPSAAVGLLRGPSSGLPGEIIGSIEKSYGSTLGTMFSGDFPAWTVSMQSQLPDRQVEHRSQLWRAPGCRISSQRKQLAEPGAAGGRRRCATRAQRARPTPSAWTRRARRASSPNAASKPKRRSTRPA